MLYEQIIARVIGDSRERFAAEGADTAVLSELQKVRCAGEGILALADAGARARARAGGCRGVRGTTRAVRLMGAARACVRRAWQLWWEKLQHSGIVGSSFRGAGGVGGAGGYHHHHHHHHHHLPPKAEDHVLQFPSGAPPARMAPSHAGSEAYGKVNVKHELPQTDGADVAEGDAGVAASRSVRRPRRGDYVEVQVGLGVEGSAAAAGGPAILSLQQLDGAGSGPRKRKLDEEDGGAPTAVKPAAAAPSARARAPSAFPALPRTL